MRIEDFFLLLNMPSSLARSCLSAHSCPSLTGVRSVFSFVSTASKFSEALSDHVLGEFTRTERKELDNIVADACDAVEHWIEEEDMAKVMTRFNSPR